jgi:hypothetical protein
MAKKKPLSKDDFKEDIKSKKGLVNPLKNLLSKRVSDKNK